MILLDEIEKAHPDVLNILLQLFDEGRLTDSKGRTIDFKNTIIIMTSNLGAELIINTLNKISKSPLKSTPVSAQNLTESKIIKMKSKNNDDNSDANKEWDEMMIEMNALIKKSFKPEFVNRIDEIVVFKALSIKEVENIVRLMLEKTSRLLNAQKISVEYSEEAVKEIAKIGYDPQYGARPLQRIIRRYIENPLSEKILSEEVSENDKVEVEFKNGEFTFNKK
ncbi:MAG TPA: AAA family ATPase [Candidatus Dojkabacteria bacterium]|nr:AAA family ATPase [Candidatus Dojkabacteria bacterium]